MNSTKLLISLIIAFSLVASLKSLAKETSVQLSKLERILFSRVNIDRSKFKKSKFILNKRLCKLARDHAEDMLKNDFFGHTSSKGLNAQQRAKEAGVKVAVYENIGWRSGPDPKSEMVLALQKSFMNEPKDQRNHRYILLLDKLKYAGIGVSIRKDQVAIVQIFTESAPNE